MTTVTHPDITHKKGVPQKFNPNSYRVITENVPEYESIPAWYGRSRPEPLYTEPNAEQLPAQALEARNNPHAARKVDMVYTNAATFNAPLGIVKTDNVKKEESRWWDWSEPKNEQYGPGVRSQDEWSKIRESSYRNAFNIAGETGPYAKKNTRYSANPLHMRTTGIVPITELKPDYLETVDQTLNEKVSFEQQYNSRNDTNYPLRGKRHGAFVLEEQKPQVEIPPPRSVATTSAKLERGASMWDLFHPRDGTRGQIPTNPYKYRRPLPEIKRTEDYGQVWQTAPYANDYQLSQTTPYANDYHSGPAFQRPPVMRQVDND